MLKVTIFRVYAENTIFFSDFV